MIEDFYSIGLCIMTCQVNWQVFFYTNCTKKQDFTMYDKKLRWNRTWYADIIKSDHKRKEGG